ncbi:glycerophosphocholine cholinephosphodiesterase ENPP6-like [Amphibalanus amphitrite]|uniref:glycerophosphocholine cholinephosphodiesterase ENPP6-like n=1 Tax=Amphibalanus amphitrite TaxID=1232801 RepID=UPI001C90EE47|nr:glycerophosphocholine cholinephosphodiesterase ENPP6-like [Amphibalanus amphitrite]
MDRTVRQRRAEDEPVPSHRSMFEGTEKDHQNDEWLSRRGRNMVLVILLYVVVCTGVFVWFQVGRQPPKMLVLSISALRHDYLSKVPSRDAPFFTHFLRYGSRAEYLSPTFPSGGVASMTSIYTGLYPEKHGVLGEHFMDRKQGELKLKGPAGHSADDAAWWGGSLPFWNSAVKQWRKAALFNVPGGCVPFDGYAPHTCTAPTDDDAFSENLSRALDLLLSEEHAYNLAVVHTNVLRRAAEEHGADSKRLLDELLTLDARLQQMDRQLLDLQMRDNVNIIIVSDGGLTDTETAEVVHIDRYLPPEVGVTIAGNGAVCYVYADEAHHDLVYGVIGNVPGAKTYRRHEIPERYRISHPDRAPDVLLVAAPGSYIENTAPLTVAAAGGYDDTEGNAPDMRGVLLARGPSFKQGVVVQPVSAVDVYPLLTALLDVTSEVHSGSMLRTTDMVNW